MTSDQKRHSIVQDYLNRGYNIQSDTATSVVLVRQKRVGWFWNLLLTLLTGGFWLIVWGLRAATARSVKTLNFTPDGNLIASIATKPEIDIKGFSLGKNVWLAVGAFVLVIALIGSIANGISQGNSNLTTQDPSPTPTVSFVYADVSRALEQGISETQCESLAFAISNAPVNKILKSRLKTVLSTSKKDEYAAKSFVDKYDWASSAGDEGQKFAGEVSLVASAAYKNNLTLISEAELSKAARDFENAWLPSFQAAMLEKCGSKSAYEKTLSRANQYSDALVSINASALLAPWYPRGYREYEGDPNVAWRWGKAGSCEYFSEGCWVVKVATLVGCPNSLYVEITVNDKQGNAIGYTNAVSGRLGAGKTAKLQLDSYDSGASSASLSQINCY